MTSRPFTNRAAGLAAALSLASCAQLGPRYDWLRDEPVGPPAGVIDSFIGIRQMEDEERWSPLDDQFDVGLALQTPFNGPASWSGESVLDRLHWDLGARFAGDRDEVQAPGGGASTDREIQTFDITAGLLLAGSPWARVQPYVGGGLALVYTDTDLQIGGGFASSRDTVVTGYARGGFRIPLRSGKHAGIDVRWLAPADADIDGIGADIGALTVSLIFGAQF